MDPPEKPMFTFTYPGSNTLNFKLPICKNNNGTYSFYFENYMFLKIMNHDQTSWNVLSLKWLISFYKILSILFIKFFSSIFNNIK